MVTCGIWLRVNFLCIRDWATLVHTQIVKVLVRAKNGLLYNSMQTTYGWNCGKCARGNLGPLPKVGEHCRVCDSAVAAVIEVADIERIELERRWNAPPWD